MKSLLTYKKKFIKNNKIHFEKNLLSINSFLEIFKTYYSILENLNYINFKLIISIPDYILVDKGFLNFYLNLIIKLLNEIELIESSYLVVGRKKIYIIFSLRSMSPFNEQIKNNIFQHFMKFPEKVDIDSISILKGNAFNYFLKIIKYPLSKHFFNIYSKQNKNLEEIYAILLDLITNLNDFGACFEIKQILNNYYQLLNFELNKNNEYYLIYLWKVYFKINKYSISLENGILYIYNKNLNSQYTYDRKSSISFLLSNHNSIIKELINEFPIQLSNLDLEVMTLKFFEKAFNLISSNYFLVCEEFILNKNLIEFKNGIYLINKNIFLLFNTKELFTNKIFSSIYIEHNFSNEFVNNTQFIEEIISNIDRYFFFYKKKEKIEYLLLNLGKIINNLSLFDNEIYISKDKLFIVSYLQEIIQEVIKSKNYLDLINYIAPFFILIKLFQLYYNNIDLFNKAVNLYNMESYTSTKYGKYHPKITDYHKKNFKIFFFSINNYYLNIINKKNLDPIITDFIEIKKYLEIQ